MPVISTKGPHIGAASEHQCRTRRAAAVEIGTRKDGFPDLEMGHYGAPPLPGHRGDYADRAAPPHTDLPGPSSGGLPTPFEIKGG